MGLVGPDTTGRRLVIDTIGLNLKCIKKKSDKRQYWSSRVIELHSLVNLIDSN
jgi:hypothetical protein